MNFWGNLVRTLLQPETLRLIAMALLHFVWQGAAIAALAWMAMAVCRTATVRYAIAVAAMVAMAAAPVVTWEILRTSSAATMSAASNMGAADEMHELKLAVHGVEHQAAALPGVARAIPAMKSARTQVGQKTISNAFLLLVELWFAGVMLFSLRSAGGFLLVSSLRRKDTKPVSEELLAICMAVQRKMGVERVVRYCECLYLEAPAVAGWVRPAVLLPLRALSGLSETQLEALIAHELAHIQRFDAFVNLFQIGVETLLFYHPAVWLLGRRIREERENCCDDRAVELCGSPLGYAKALARLAECGAAPRMAMAANHGPLASRIARLLGVKRSNPLEKTASLSAGVLCFSAALLAGSAFLGVARTVRAELPSSNAALLAHARTVLQEAGTDVEKAAKANPGLAAAEAELSKLKNPSERHFVDLALLKAEGALTQLKGMQTPVELSVPVPAPVTIHVATPTSLVMAMPSPAPMVEFQNGQTQAGREAASSYIDGLHAAGLTDISIDELIALKSMGVTPEYVKEMKQMGIRVDADNLIAMRAQGISAEYVHEMRGTLGENLGGDDLIGLKVQGVTPAYVKGLRDLGLKVEADDVIAMKVQGVTPEYVKEMRDSGVNADTDELVGMKVQGITPEYVRSLKALGLTPDTDQLIGMKVQGVTAEYIKSLQSAGFKVDLDEAIDAKVQGITPEFVAQAKAHAFKDLTLEKLIMLKQTGVLESETTESKEKH